MSDNTQLNAGFGGDVIATDDVGGVKYQRVKPAFGPDGEAVDVSASNPLPVTLGVPTLPVADATLAELQDAIRALNDSVLYMAAAILDKMPTLDRTDRVRVDMTDYGVGGSAYAWSQINGVSNPSTGYTFTRLFEPWNFSDAGSARLYQQIIVS